MVVKLIKVGLLLSLAVLLIACGKQGGKSTYNTKSDQYVYPRNTTLPPYTNN